MTWHTRSKQFFGEEHIEEVNFRPPAPPTQELLGLEYLFRQSSADFSLSDMYRSTKEALMDDGPTEDEDNVSEDVPEEEDDAGYTSDASMDNTLPITREHLNLTDDTVTSPVDPSCEDVCSSNPLPGYEKVEALALLFVALTKEESLFLSSTQRNAIISAWNALEEYDKQPQEFKTAYRSRWGHTLFKRTCGDAEEAAVTQRIKMGARYTPAHLVDAKKNRLVYCIIKLLWFEVAAGKSKASSPDMLTVNKRYDRLQHMVVVDDHVLSKMGIPLVKINAKSVREFVRPQEALAAANATPQPSVTTRKTHVADQDIPDAPQLPEMAEPSEHPKVVYTVKESEAGQRTVKLKHDQPMRSRKETSASVTVAQPAPAPSASHPLPTLNVIIASSSSSSASTSSSAALHPCPPPPVLSSSQEHHPQQPSASKSTPSSMHTAARSTYYKQLKRERAQIELGGPALKKPKPCVPRCGLCGGSTQGHSKYKKKTWCSVTKRSTSKGLSDREYTDYEQFKAAVDDLSK